MDDFSIGDRLRALRALCGYAKPADLADALRARGVGTGLGQTNLYAIERGAKVPDPRDMRAIAELCGVPAEWFTADFSRLGEISEDPRQALARSAHEVAERIAARRTEPPSSRRSRKAAGP